MIRSSKHNRTSLTLGIDPGLNGTGYALLALARQRKTWKFLKTGVVRVGRKHGKLSFELRAHEIACTLQRELTDFHGLTFDKVLIEWPAHWDGSAKSRAATNRGDLLKLAMLIGIIYENFCVFSYGDFPELIPPHAWKGQLPKRVVVSRIKKAIKDNKIKGIDSNKIRDHEADAIGISLNFHGMI